MTAAVKSCRTCSRVKVLRKGIWLCLHCDQPCEAGRQCPTCRKIPKGELT